MSSIPTLPTVPVLAPPQADPYYGFGGQEFEISLNSPIFNEGLLRLSLSRHISPTGIGYFPQVAPMRFIRCAWL